MKKLNRKGFTLIELLAVIVILAIILVVTVPNIISSISDARVSSIHNLAKSTATTYDKAYAQDLVATSGNEILGNIIDIVDGNWKCIGDISGKKNNGTTSVTLAAALGLSENDVNLFSESVSGTIVANETNIESMTVGNTANYCSSIRINNGSAEVILVAKNSGKFYVAQKATYAYSAADSGVSR